MHLALNRIQVPTWIACQSQTVSELSTAFILFSDYAFLCILYAFYIVYHMCAVLLQCCCTIKHLIILSMISPPEPIMLCTAIKQPQNSFNVKFHVLVYEDVHLWYSSCLGNCWQPSCIGVRAGDKVLLCCASSVTDDEFTKYYTSKNTSSEETSLKIVSRSEPKSQWLGDKFSSLGDIYVTQL